ncbi:lyase family protein [Nonomuraea recticatena]|uniref:lyase family protein n=1 Tax=Nonomuraea recticatena TaxID=46178 RepID=UPI0036238E70
MLPTGRIRQAPASLLERTVLNSRFDWEVQHLLRHYQWIEMVQTEEYVRMGVLDPDMGERIRGAVAGLSAEEVAAEHGTTMSDTLFAMERALYARIPAQATAWHVDRSRNDVQACAQLMFGRERLLGVAETVRGLADAAVLAASGHTGSIMPGHTQHQWAQAITLGFYLAALAEAATTAAESLHALYDGINLSPLGAGALAGLELPWDRSRMAAALGFHAPQPHALTSVASRGWVLRCAAELSVLGTTVSRFLTDLLWWSGSSCRFIDLPDELAGISSAMPHKRNFPILERIRGMSGHLVGLSFDLMIGQRNTGYTNLVEVSKESTRFLEDLFDTSETMLALLQRVIADLRFHPDRAGKAVNGEPLAAAAVANHLTLENHVPARTAQVIVGSWIAAGAQDDPAPDALSLSSLAVACEEQGYRLRLGEDRLRELLDAEEGCGADGRAAPPGRRTFMNCSSRPVNGSTP